MSEYVSAHALLADLRLRLDAFEKQRLGVLVVEGPDDKRVFARHIKSLAQVFPAGGRRILLEAHSIATPADLLRIAFLTDCDYEVRRKQLNPGPGLIITTKTDVESDLIDLGLLYSVIVDVLPAAMQSERRAIAITTRVLDNATTFALPLGRIRMAAQPFGVPLGLDEIRHRKYWDSKSHKVDVDKLIRTTHACLRDAGLWIELDDWRQSIEGTPDDVGMCHGKDLVRAVYYFLQANYSLPSDVKAETISRLLRTSLWRQDLARWGVGRRLRNWEEHTGRVLLH